MTTNTPPKTATPTTPPAAPAGTATVPVVPPVAGKPAAPPAKAGAAGAKAGGAAPATKPAKPAATPAAPSTPAAGELPDLAADADELPDLTTEGKAAAEGEGDEPSSSEAEGTETPSDENAPPIEYTFTTPEGHEALDSEVLGPLATWLNEQKVGQAEAQKLVDTVVPALQQAGQARLAAMLESGEAELRERHGNKLPEVMRLAAIGARQFGPQFRELLKPGGLLSRSPDTIEGLAAIGRMKSNDRPPRGTRQQVPVNETPQQELARQYDESEKQALPR